MSKLGTVLVCLLFAACFGGVGAGASWALWRMVYDGQRAQDWVGVRAQVDSYSRGSVTYHYAFNGREYKGDRMGPDPLGGTDNLDSWHADMAARLGEARDSKTPVTVWVNPDNPAESMVDRNVRWKLAVFMLPFALGFGGVGVGALYMLVRTLVKGDAAPASVARPSNRIQGLAATWAFAILWNVIAFPVGLLVIPLAMNEGHWGALFVLLFPLIGVLILWGAIKETLRRIRAFVTRNVTVDTQVSITPAPAPARADGFARGMIDDPRADGGSAVIDAEDTGLPPPPDPSLAEIEKLAGKKLTAEEREQYDRMSPGTRAMVAKVAGWVGKMRQPQ